MIIGKRQRWQYRMVTATIDKETERNFYLTSVLRCGETGYSRTSIGNLYEERHLTGHPFEYNDG